MTSFVFSTVTTSVAQELSHLKFQGTGSCSSSVCHGSISARSGSRILQNEYVIWSNNDKHSKAWSALTSSDGQLIGKHLGISAPEKEPLCLSCHATFDRSAKVAAPSEQLADGVGCESCHGAAEKYLHEHTHKGADHRSNVENGMRDLVPYESRAKLCLSCHLGSDDYYVSHRLMGSGHPRLTFELDTFSIAQPRHWVVDADYVERKGDYSPVRAWIIGQLERGIEMVKALKSGARSRFGAYPELTNFYCYSCHHSLGEKQFRTHQYGGRPGELRINLSSILVAAQGLKVLAPNAELSLTGAIEALHEDDPAALGAIQADLEGALTAVGKVAIADREAQGLLKALLAYGSESRSLPYEVAEQIAMGVSSVAASLDPSGKRWNGELKGIYGALKTPDAFDPDVFTSALARARNKMVQ